MPPKIPQPPAGLEFNTPMQADGYQFLQKISNAFAAAVFFDPQYRGILDKLAYGNEGVRRGQQRSGLPQMDATTITKFLTEIQRILKPSGHLFLWVDKFHLCSGITPWLNNLELEIVDLITWDKQRMGMGYRTRRQAEYLIVLQKPPKRAKGIWLDNSIRDCVAEKVVRRNTHAKPVDLQARLINAVTKANEVIVDPAAGTFSVLKACEQVGNRYFLGCDIQLREG